jgi:ribose transport system permease protein
MGAFGRAPVNIIFASICFFIAYFLMTRSPIGIYTNAIGSNEKAASNMGINVNKCKIIAFVLAGMFAGMMSVLTVSYGNAMSPSANMTSMARSFTPLMGCFFAIAFKRSIHPIVSILVGELIIAMIISGLIAIGFPSTLQNLIIGVILLTIIILTSHPKRDAVVK